MTCFWKDLVETTQTCDGGWSVAASLPGTLYESAGFGEGENALAVTGGYAAGCKTGTKEFDGASWSSGGALTTARHRLGGCGTLSAGLTAGGSCSGTFYNNTEEYDGSTWSAGGALTEQKNKVAVTGFQSAALCTGGDLSVGSTSRTELYDGATWANASADYPAAANENVACSGTQSDALGAGGTTGAPAAGQDETYSWDGAAWSAEADVPWTASISAAQMTGTGTTSFLSCGVDSSGVYLSNTGLWDGSAWQADSAMPSPRSLTGGAGNTGQYSMAAGGFNGSALSSCYLWSPTIVTEGDS